MIRNEKGITLVILVITVIVLMIIALVSINLGGDTIEEVKEKKNVTELSTVQQAIFQQFALLESYLEDGIIAEVQTEDVIMREDVNRPELLLGLRIVDEETLDEYGFTEYVKKYTDTMTFEEFYYLLDEEDLNELGIKKDEKIENDFSYIVNYSTGEVFDIVNKTYIKAYESNEIEIDNTVIENILKIEEEKYDFTE